MMVLVRDRLCMETMDGFVDKGGEGRHDRGVSKEVRELMREEVGAMEGD